MQLRDRSKQGVLNYHDSPQPCQATDTPMIECVMQHSISCKASVCLASSVSLNTLQAAKVDDVLPQPPGQFHRPLQNTTPAHLPDDGKNILLFSVKDSGNIIKGSGALSAWNRTAGWPCPATSFSVGCPTRPTLYRTPSCSLIISSYLQTQKHKQGDLAIRSDKFCRLTGTSLVSSTKGR